MRQDFLIAQGLLQPYEHGAAPDPRLLQKALARLRQLAAHEVGHTLGLQHNFAGSADGRTSVMDYPPPSVALDDQGEVDLSRAYAAGIGEWDKRTILYGYQDFPAGTDERAGLQTISTRTSPGACTTSPTRTRARQAGRIRWRTSGTAARRPPTS